MRGIVGRNIYMYSASRRGFTLIELTVVLLIVAILAGVVTLRLQGPLHRAEMRDVIERIAFFDHLTRVHAASTTGRCVWSSTSWPETSRGTTAIRSSRRAPRSSCRAAVSSRSCTSEATRSVPAARR